MKRLVLAGVLALACSTVAVAQVAPPQLSIPPIIPDPGSCTPACTFTNSTMLANFQQIQADIAKMNYLYSQVQQLQRETSSLNGMQFSSWSSIVQGSSTQTCADAGQTLAGQLFSQANGETNTLSGFEGLLGGVQGATGAGELNAGIASTSVDTQQQQLALQGMSSVTTCGMTQAAPSAFMGAFDLNEPADAGWQNI